MIYYCIPLRNIELYFFAMEMNRVPLYIFANRRSPFLEKEGCSHLSIFL